MSGCLHQKRQKIFKKISDYRFLAELMGTNCLAHPVKSGLISPGKHLNTSAGHLMHIEVNTES